jgi:hypothetical protein
MLRIELSSRRRVCTRDGVAACRCRLRDASLLEWRENTGGRVSRGPADCMALEAPVSEERPLEYWPHVDCSTFYGAIASPIVTMAAAASKEKVD